MDLEKLCSLAALAETGNYTLAAERLYMTQSNLSKHIMALENELNVQLVDRSHKAVALTEAGQITARHALRLISEYKAMLRELESRSPVMRVASLPVMAQYDITGIVSDYQRIYPNAKLILDEVEGVLLLDMLLQETYDLAFARTEQGFEHPALEKQIICRDRMAAILPRTHPLAVQPVISLSTLRNETFIMLDRTSTLYAQIIDACRLAGFEPTIAYTGRRMENITDLVARGAGVSLLMEHAASYLHNDQVTIVPLSEPIVSEVSLVRLKRQKLPEACRFWDFVKNAVAERQD